MIRRSYITVVPPEDSTYLQVSPLYGTDSYHITVVPPEDSTSFSCHLCNGTDALILLLCHLKIVHHFQLSPLYGTASVPY